MPCLLLVFRGRYIPKVTFALSATCRTDACMVQHTCYRYICMYIGHHKEVGGKNVVLYIEMLPTCNKSTLR